MRVVKHLKQRQGTASRRPAQSGFTLVELMVTLIVLGVVMAIAFPSFRYVTNSGRVTNPANELLATLQTARMESIRRGQRTVVCRTDNADAAAPACVAAAGNWGGWLAFVDADRDGTLDAGEVVLRVTGVQAPAIANASAAISGASNRVIFRPDGLARTAAGALLAAKIRICVADTLPADNARDIEISAGSRLSVVRVNAGGACAAPANT